MKKKREIERTKKRQDSIKYMYITLSMPLINNACENISTICNTNTDVMYIVITLMFFYIMESWVCGVPRRTPS